MQPGLLAVKAKQLAFVRAPAAAEDARRLVEGQRANRSDDDPEFLEALSWVARAGAFVENWDLAGQYAEEARISIRNVRRSARDELDRLEADGAISEDDRERYEKQIDELTSSEVAKVDQQLKGKETELKEI